MQLIHFSPGAGHKIPVYGAGVPGWTPRPSNDTDKAAHLAKTVDSLAVGGKLNFVTSGEATRGVGFHEPTTKLRSRRSLGETLIAFSIKHDALSISQ